MIMPVLKLDNNNMLYSCFPQEPEFVEDEIEIWLDSFGEKTCLFKDSLHYVLAVECAWVVNHCEIQANQADVCFPRLFFDYCLQKNSDESYLNHLFPDYNRNSICLSKTPCGNMKLEIWNVDPFAEPEVCEFRYSFNVSFHEFMEWWNQLMALDHLQ